MGLGLRAIDELMLGEALRYTARWSVCYTHTACVTPSDNACTFSIARLLGRVALLKTQKRCLLAERCAEPSIRASTAS